MESKTYSKDINSSNPSDLPTEYTIANTTPFKIVYPSGLTNNVYRRFMNNLRIVTNIPALRMVASFSTQAIWYNYTKSNNLAADGNARWNEASQTLMQDMQVWNMISDYQVEVLYADQTGDESKLYESAYKIKFICADNLTQEIADLINYDFDFDADQIIDWVINNEKSTVSPFSDEDYVNSYYADAQEILAESEAVLAEGQQDNTRGDTFNLVTVIYSVVLFMLGIVGTFRRLPNRLLITCVAIAGFLFGTIYMFTIPMPTGFSFLSFFGG